MDLERLVIRLVGESTSFTRMMRDSEAHMSRWRERVLAINQVAGAQNWGATSMGNMVWTSQLASAQIERMQIRLESLAESATMFGSKLMRNVTLPLTALGVASVYAFSQFESAMAKIMAFNPGQDKNFLSNAVLGTARNSPQSTTDIAGGLGILLKSGYDNPAVSAQALGVAEAFATANSIKMTDAVRDLTTVQVAMGMRTKDGAKNLESLAHISDVLTKATTLSGSSVETLAEGLQIAGPSARFYGISLEETTAAIAGFTREGLRGWQAGRYFSTALRELQTGNIRHKESWDLLEVSVYKTDGSLKSMSEILGTLKGKMADASPEQRRTMLMFMGMTDRSIQATLAMMNLSDTTEEWTEELKEATGFNTRASYVMKETLVAQFGIMRNRVFELAVEIGGHLLPTFQRMLNGVGNVTEWFRNLDPASKTLAVNIGLIAASIGPAIFLIGGLTAAFAMLWGVVFSPIGAIVVVAGAIAAIAYELGVGSETAKTMGDEWSKSWDAIMRDVEGGRLQHAFQTLTLSIKVMWLEMLTEIRVGMQGSFQHLGDWIDSIGVSTKEYWKNIGQGPEKAAEIAERKRAEFLSGRDQRTMNRLTGPLEEADKKLTQMRLEADPSYQEDKRAFEEHQKYLERSSAVQNLVGRGVLTEPRQYTSMFNMMRGLSGHMGATFQDITPAGSPGKFWESLQNTMNPAKLLGFDPALAKKLAFLEEMKSGKSPLFGKEKGPGDTFAEYSMRRFELEGPGGLARPSAEAQEVKIDGLMQKLDDIVKAIELGTPAQAMKAWKQYDELQKRVIDPNDRKRLHLDD
jgi:TP901 family phage tail tape measure protein